MISSLLLLLLFGSALVACTHRISIGIDLGTTRSSVAIYHNGKVQVLTNWQGERSLPSYVAFTDAGERLVGQPAKEYAVISPNNVIYDTKRLIGQRLQDREVLEQLDKVLLTVIEKDGKAAVQVVIGGEIAVFSAEAISEIILQELKTLAESYYGQTVSSAVITVPAWFNDAQRQATKAAAGRAGFEVERIVNEPAAAAMAYHLDRLGGKFNFFVYDLGGGTYDASLFTYEDGVPEVRATAGNFYLGGNDFDRNMADYIARLWNAKSGRDCTHNATAMSLLLQKSEVTKIILSSQETARIEIEAFHNALDLNETLTRTAFELLNENLFQATLPHINKTLVDAGMDRQDVNYVILSGGSTRIPRVATLVHSFFNNKTKVLHGINPEEVVAHGAAIEAQRYSYRPGPCSCGGMLFSSAGTYGVENVDGTVIPISPDQGWRADNEWKRSARFHVFTTAADGQSTFHVRLFRSTDKNMTTDNTLIAQLNLTGITQAPRGIAKINVTVMLDERGRISLEAVDVTPDSTDDAVLSPKVSAHLDVGGYWTFPTKEETRQYEEEKRLEREEAQREAEREAIQVPKTAARLEFVSYATALIERMRNGRDSVGRNEKLNIADEKQILQALAAARAWIESRDEFASSIDVVHEQRRRLESVVEPIFARFSAKSVRIHDEL
ncbi:ATPase with role in protein import into the ER [Geranomyces variabilis]|nr:ATPase with role in protein import into the ER [Geranomyces variabilis]